MTLSKRLRVLKIKINIFLLFSDQEKSKKMILKELNDETQASVNENKRKLWNLMRSMIGLNQESFEATNALKALEAKIILLGEDNLENESKYLQDHLKNLKYLELQQIKQIFTRMKL